MEYSKEEVAEAYKRLGTYKKVQEELGCSAATTHRALKEFGLCPGKGGNQTQKITDEEILSGISGGLTRQQIADRYGVHVENLARRMKHLGVHAKYAPNARFGTISGDCWHYVRTQDEKTKEALPNFQYIESRRDRIRLKCRTCGDIIERNRSSFVNGTVQCDRCEEERRAKQRTEKELSEKRISLVRVLSALTELKKPKQCYVCGETFYSQYKDVLYCSDKCRRKHKGKSKGIRHRCRKYGVYYDPTVTPQKVFERDHYQCGICGLFCIPGDTSWNGHFGPYSPTVDHIVALANGGSHTWDNVQCAHAMCNSKKRDLITAQSNMRT